MSMDIKTNAKIRSLNSIEKVTIKEKIGNNQFLVDYKGIACVAMFNPFEGMYYVDDIYGTLPSLADNEWDRAVQEMKYLYESNERELEAYRKLGSVSYLRQLKNKECKKIKKVDKASQDLINIFVGSFAGFCIWSIIYIIATVV